MTTDESIMEQMLERVTNPNRDTSDALGIQMFCMVAEKNVHKSQQLLVTKIRSHNVTESTRAIELLEACMSKCGVKFQDEVGKFRFLNDLIRLVSKKYQGAETPAPIKQRIMECLLLWTTEYPQQSKIKEAYDNLNKEGDVEHGNAKITVTKRESTLGIDPKVFSELINSGNPENFKRANLLIQNRVQQDTRRMELRVQHKSELQEVQNTVSLLDQMLDTYESDAGKEIEEGSETKNLIRELYIACKRHKPILQQLLNMNEDADEDLTADTLETFDLLTAVMTRYNSIVVHAKSKEQNETPAKKTAKTVAPTASSNANQDLLAELLGDTLSSAPATADAISLLAKPTDKIVPANGSAAVSNSTKTLEELHDIFGNLNDTNLTSESATTTLNSEKTTDALLNNLELLKPVNVFVEANTKNGFSDTLPVTEKRTFREMPEIDELSAELFKQSLPSAERVSSFKKQPDKIALKDLAKEKSNPTVAIAKANSMEEIDMLPTLDANDVAKMKQTTEMLDLTENVTSTHDIPENNENISSSTNNNITENIASQLLPVKHLSDIKIDLDEITPTSEERILMDDDDVKITLNFTTERPSRHVSVIVMSVVNKSKLPVNDFQFEASVKKPSKIRLLPPTDTRMPPHKPFRPATPINQVLLLLNPTGQSVDVTCIMGYKLGDDPDPIKESIVAKDIPYRD